MRGSTSTRSMSRTGSSRGGDGVKLESALVAGACVVVEFASSPALAGGDGARTRRMRAWSLVLSRRLRVLL